MGIKKAYSNLPDPAGHNENELLDYLVSCGKINESELNAFQEKMKEEKYLEIHFGKNYTLQPGKDGRYFTRFPDGSQLRRTGRSDFIYGIVTFYETHPQFLPISKRPSKVADQQFSVKSEPLPQTVSLDRSKTISDVFREWIDFRKRYENVCKGTIDRSEDDFLRFFIKNPLAQDLMHIPMADIDENELEKLVRGTIKDYHLNAKGWAKFKALIKGIWLYGLKYKTTDLYITRFFDIVAIKPRMLAQTVEDDQKQVFTDEEARLLLDEIDSRGYSVINYGIVLCFYTGMRSGELSGLKWEDVSPDFKSLTVNNMEILYKDEDEIRRKFEVVPHAKTQAGLRKVIIPDAFIPYFEKLWENREDEEFVFFSNGERIHARSFSDKLSSLCKQLGITDRRMHKIRKTVCSKLLDSGVDKCLITRQIGHASIQVTENNYHKDRRVEDEKREIFNKTLTY